MCVCVKCKFPNVSTAFVKSDFKSMQGFEKRESPKEYTINRQTVGLKKNGKSQ